MAIRDDGRNPSAEPPEVLTTVDARQASRSHVNWKVLIWGLLLVVAAFAAVYFILQRSG